MRRLLHALALLVMAVLPGLVLPGLVFPLAAEEAAPAAVVAAQPPARPDADLQAVLAANRDAILKASRGTVDAVVAALLARPIDGAQTFLERWAARAVSFNKADGRFVIATRDGDGFVLTDIVTGAETGRAARADIQELKPNAGVRAVLASALVRFTLSDPDPARRADALTAIERNPEESQLAPLRASIDGETDAALLARKQRLERLMTIRFDADPSARIAAMEGFSGDIGVDVRSVLNPILAVVRKTGARMPEGENVARMLAVGRDLTTDEAYAMLVEAGLAPARIADAERDAALAANMVDGMVGGIPREALGDDAARDAAYSALAEAGLAKPFVPAARRAELIAAHQFWEAHVIADPAITGAAKATLASIDQRLALYQAADLALDAVSLASIYFLAAIGLAITFGVMGVINMAHGEFIMMGAYTGYVVQQWIPDQTLSIVVALPLAFVVTFAAGVAMERLVIRHLMHRPLETLLATFGLSIALQQIAKNVFGTQARPLTAPAWLDGSLVFNDIVSISLIRVAIFVLALMFLGLLILILNRTRLGLEVRTVTQNRRMAASMGINPDRINMLTFGLGSGIAGIAGVAIGLFAQVTSEIGANYIVQSFMTVVVGGVGNIWGTLAGATMIGSLQKVIEFFNPSNTLAAQTYMIIFIIIFIQFRPKGIIALKGRAAGD